MRMALTTSPNKICASPHASTIGADVGAPIDFGAWRGAMMINSGEGERRQHSFQER